MGRVSLFFSTRRGLEAPLLRELQGLPCLSTPSAAAASTTSTTAGPNASIGELTDGPQPQEEAAPRLLMSPGGVLLQRVPIALVQQLCCSVRTAECVWLRLWGPARCSTPEHLQTALAKIPWHKYIRPLSALPLLHLRVASIGSPISDSPSLRSALTRALEETAAAAAARVPEAAEAADPAAAAAEKALAAATHRLRIVCVKGQALADLQLSAPLDPRPYRYLSHVPAAASASAERSLGAAAGASAAEELRLAAALAELQQASRRLPAAADPSWSLRSVVAAAGREGRPWGPWGPWGPVIGSEERASCQQGALQTAPSDPSVTSSTTNSRPPETTDGGDLLSGESQGREGPSSKPLGPYAYSGLVPRSAATVSMLRLLYLKEGGGAEALAGAASPGAVSTAAAAAADAAATTETAAAAEKDISPLWGPTGVETEEGDVSLAVAVAAAGLRRILRREKRLVLWDPFCSTGSLLLEAALLLGGLPATTPLVPSARDVIPAVSLHPQGPQQLLQQGTPGVVAAAGTRAGGRTPQITLVGTDERPLLLHAARQRLRNFCHFYYGGREPMDLETQQELQQQQTDQQQKEQEQQEHGQLSPPFAMGLHLASPFEVSPFVSGGVILTRVPCPTEAKRLRSARGKAFDFYEKLGHMVASRSDWRGVFVIVKGTSFLHYSRLEWETLVKWRDVSGRKISLQRWTGRKHAFQRTETPQQRLAALDAQDLQVLPFMED